MSEETQLVFPARTAIDVLTLAVALPTAVVALGFGLYFLIFPADAPAAPGVRLPFLSPATSDLVVLTAALSGIVIWLCARGFGALLRMLDRRPILVADLDGLRFDPTLCRKPVPWSDVRRIRATIAWKGPNKLIFDLRRRIWATESPLTARQVNIGGLHLDSIGWVTRDVVDRLEALRLRASRDPGAGG